MPRVDVPITTVTSIGVAQPSQVTGDATNGHVLANNDGLVWIEAVNSGSTTRTVTIITPGTLAGLALEDRVVTLTNAQTKLIGPLPPAIYNQDDGTVELDVSHAEVKLRAYHLG